MRDKEDNMLATDYAEYYEIEPQGDDESDSTFRQRVASELRRKGHIIEAHEALQDAFYDQNEAVADGLFGAVAQALHGTNYGGDPLGNDIAVGGLVRHQMSEEGQQEQAAKEMMVQMLLAGLSPDALGDLLD